MNKKFLGTDGNWEIYTAESLQQHWIASDDSVLEGNIICHSPDRGTKSISQWEANAALIAASPYLLKACIEVYDYLYDNGSDVETSSVNSLCDTLKAAITKALTI